MNNIHKGIKISDYLLSPSSINKINSTIDSIQKVILFYERTKPIITQTYPLLNNIKTTFKVAKTFKQMKNDVGLEQIIDSLPDYENESNNLKQTSKQDNQVAKPFYPWYNIIKMVILWK